MQPYTLQGHALPRTTLHYPALPCNTLHYHTLASCITLHYPPLLSQFLPSGTEIQVKAWNYRDGCWSLLRFCHLALRDSTSGPTNELIKYGVYGAAPYRYEGAEGGAHLTSELVCRFHNFALST